MTLGHAGGWHYQWPAATGRIKSTDSWGSRRCNTAATQRKVYCVVVVRTNGISAWMWFAWHALTALYKCAFYTSFHFFISDKLSVHRSCIRVFGNVRSRSFKFIDQKTLIGISKVHFCIGRRNSSIWQLYRTDPYAARRYTVSKSLSLKPWLDVKQKKNTKIYCANVLCSTSGQSC